MYEQFLNVIDQKSAQFCELADTVWDLAETAFGEYRSSEAITAFLKAEGFSITQGVANIPTAFTAPYGSGHPHFGILAEYDALEGMSQEGNVPVETPIPGKDTGHGCGHHLFCAGSTAAAVAVKAYIEATGKGSVTLFGCPAEENGAGKVFMVKRGVFSDVDAVVSWHPESMYMVRTRPSLANVKVRYRFKGTAAHAGGSPHKGRSALDAVELMNVGANFLREHMELTSRVHYAITDAGGSAPNQVQSHAEVLYMIRAVDAESVHELYQRVDRIAQGATLMTDTSVESQVVAGYANLVTIPTLQATANEAMHDIPFPVPSEEELAFGKALQSTMKLTAAQKAMPIFADHVLDPAPPVAHGGSTDTADVSWNVPTVQMHIGTWAVGTPGHSWQSVAQGTGTYAKKAMLFAGKAVAGTIIRLFENPDLVAKAKAEHAEKTIGGYICQIPDGIEPTILPDPRNG